ncbi:hypothetical protein ABGF49_03860 [Helcococcus ovis]|uniref:Glutaredoxin n=1 Tax=Helcococcus ovis TaxID=72026 RepID=A0A4R9C429_9FIRM|nr:glutaredoxin [Helcococcus ovis]TFF64772.1 glutaredoxin [Helcococcus ovis]TFF66641.1 glutaredoxin [Helcococcus ovis]TFF68016.1 glutaredoxin [Helcococcus ovis]WNZ01123.1 hypothetical protein EQF90_007600 [Helcococcus ovis]
MKFYGTMICGDTIHADKVLRKNKIEVEYIDITAKTRFMKEFLALRDSRVEFDKAKSDGKIGIPAFLLDDGTIEFDVYKLEGVTEKIDEDKEDEAPQMCGF